MKSVIAFLVMLSLAAQAHVGSPNVLFDGAAGAYPVHVIIRPPNVIPGIAEITIRIDDQTVEQVEVAPIFGRAGRKGAPPADEAKIVRGTTNIYSAALWLMKSGAYGVDLKVKGRRGEGSITIPVNAIATNTESMSIGYCIVLGCMGLMLFLGALKIVAVTFGESLVPPNTVPSNKHHWNGRFAATSAAGAFALLLFGGKKWWDVEDKKHKDSVYRVTAAAAQVTAERDQHLLTISHENHGRPLLPDHGKLMHLFLVGNNLPHAFAHLHPTRKDHRTFQVSLPPLPSGHYHIYADITYQDGFSETLIADAEIPTISEKLKKLWMQNSSEPVCSRFVFQVLATNLAVAPDFDDSWHTPTGAEVTSRALANGQSFLVAECAGGYEIVWQRLRTVVADAEVSLRFKLVAPNNQPAPIEPYMGMLGHAVVWVPPGIVFAHLHPEGTFSMASRDFFNGNDFVQPPTRSLAAVSTEQPQVHTHTNSIASSSGWISFPYVFPRAGLYHIWVQIKSKGTVFTGAFAITVAQAN
jgi:hypothetical protein